MFFESNSKKNLRKFKNTVGYIIEEMESSFNDFDPSCKSIILDMIEPVLNKSKEEAKNWNNGFDYITMSYKMIYIKSFNALSSGYYHIYRGVLNPMNESTHLLKVCKLCLDWYEEKGIVDSNSKKEQLEILYENIESVG